MWWEDKESRSWPEIQQTRPSLKAGRYRTTQTARRPRHADLVDLTDLSQLLATLAAEGAN